MKDFRKGLKHNFEERAHHSSTLALALRLWPDVRTIEDRLTPIGIHVSQADIDGAIPGNPAQCAVARGFCRTAGATGALIANEVALLVYGSRVERCRVPFSTRVRLGAFDLSKTSAEPGIYMLAPVPPSARLEKMQGREALSKASAKRPLKNKKTKRRPWAGNAGTEKRVSPFRIWGNASLPTETVLEAQ